MKTYFNDKVYRLLIPCTLVVFLLAFIFACSEPSQKSETEKEPQCKSKITISLRGSHDEPHQTLDHFKKLLNENFDAYLYESIQRVDCESSSQSVNYDIIEKSEPNALSQFIQLSFSTYDNCNCTQLLDTFVLVWYNKERDKINNLYDSKIEDLNTRMAVIENDIQKIEKQTPSPVVYDSIRKLESEFVRLIEQKANIRIDQADESSRVPFKVIEGASSLDPN